MLCAGSRPQLSTGGTRACLAVQNVMNDSKEETVIEIS